MAEQDLSWTPFNFLALPDDQSALETSRVVLVPVPYDSTTSFRSGARDGPRAIIEASQSLEDYDVELAVDVASIGIHTTPWLEPHMDGPRAMISRVQQAVSVYAAQGKLVGLLGGEHSITIGGAEAYVELYPGLSVLYLDAHADYRDSYMGTSWGHASAARRVSELCPVVHAGVRSMSQEEAELLGARGNQGESRSFPWESGPTEPYLESLADRLSDEVYISVDLDVLDPSLMAAVGTPEPGGMGWTQINRILAHVARRKKIVGFDVVELSPDLGPPACSVVAAKLVYRIVAYAASPPRLS